MSELAPGWTKVRMTKAQVRKYIQNMKNAQRIAQEKFEKAKANWEFEKEKLELEILEKKLEEEFDNL